MILNGISKERLPQKTAEKIHRIYQWHEYHLLQGNLKVMIDKIDKKNIYK